MGRTIGLIEFKTTPSGMVAADRMVKTAEIELLEAGTVCPGKYIALIAGTLSAVTAAVEAARSDFSEHYIDSFVLGNPHDSIFPALYGASDIKEVDAVGILETYDVASIIVAADIAAKTAIVDLVEIRIAKGMCGKSFMIITGEVAACEAAIAKAAASAAQDGMLLDKAVIARPDRQIIESIL